jgi:hypothetical protein
MRPVAGKEDDMLDPFKTNGGSPPQPDLKLTGHGTIYLLQPITLAARDWVAEHMPDDATWCCGAVAVEHRFIDDIVLGAIRDGLEVR